LIVANDRVTVRGELLYEDSLYDGTLGVRLPDISGLLGRSEAVPLTGLHTLTIRELQEIGSNLARPGIAFEGTGTSTATIHSFLAEAVGTVGRKLGGGQIDLVVVASARTAMEAAHDLLGQSLVGKGTDHRGDNQQTVHLGTDEC